jgi:hypothetical protein
VGKYKKTNRRLRSWLVILTAAFALTLGGKLAAHHFAKKTAVVKPQDVVWHYNSAQNKWLPNGTPPACADPVLGRSPVDLTKVTAVLYPGQYRGESYNANGGFRFDDSSSDDIEVFLPINAKLARLSSYIENGDQQYSLFFINPCGIAVKFDHLLKLSDTYQAIVDRLRPNATVNSAVVPVEPQIAAKKGDRVAEAVGLPSERSVSVDFGVYDLRTPNKISQQSKWTYYHTVFKSTEWFGVCWFDLLPGDDKDKLKDLLSSSFDPTAKSDYCQAPAGATI